MKGCSPQLLEEHTICPVTPPGRRVGPLVLYIMVARALGYNTQISRATRLIPIPTEPPHHYHEPLQSPSLSSSVSEHKHQHSSDMQDQPIISSFLWH